MPGDGFIPPQHPRYAHILFDGHFSIPSKLTTPARCRGPVELLNRHNQVGLPRGASGFSLDANMLTTPSARIPYSECWLKSNRPPRAGQGLTNNLTERDLTIKEISFPGINTIL
jgi:hypothetical protein